MEKQINRSAMAKTETVLELLKRKAKEGYGEFPLPVSGITVTMRFFTAKEAILCQKIATQGESINEELMYGAMIAESCMFNGEKMVSEDVIQYLHGVDYMFLVGKLSGAQELPESK